MQTQAEIRKSITTSIVNSLNEGRLSRRKCWASVDGSRRLVGDRTP